MAIQRRHGVKQVIAHEPVASLACVLAAASILMQGVFLWDGRRSRNVESGAGQGASALPAVRKGAHDLTENAAEHDSAVHGAEAALARALAGAGKTDFGLAAETEEATAAGLRAENAIQVLVEETAKMTEMQDPAEAIEGTRAVASETAALINQVTAVDAANSGEIDTSDLVL